MSSLFLHVFNYKIPEKINKKTFCALFFMFDNTLVITPLFEMSDRYISFW